MQVKFICGFWGSNFDCDGISSFRSSKFVYPSMHFSIILDGWRFKRNVKTANQMYLWHYLTLAEFNGG